MADSCTCRHPPTLVSLPVERERMAEALQIQKMFGEQGPLWIASRIGALNLAGDTAGVERFRAIAVEYDKLLANAVQ